MAGLEDVQEMQEGARLTLLNEDLVLLGGCYRHGNFGRVRVEELDERLPFFGSCELEATGVVGEQGRTGRQAIPFPPNDPDPIPSGAGAGWAIGVALP